jgi:cytidylate kinase
MSIVTVSRGSHSHGKEVAEKVCRRLGYECLAREVLSEASDRYRIPEMELVRAIEAAPTFLDRVRYAKEKYVAYVQAALLRHFLRDNVVYHGMAGHFFVQGVPHVLKVRIIADLEERIRIVMERDQVSRREAGRFVRRIDEERRKWSRHMYDIDTTDPSLYDLVIHVGKLTVADAADLICQTVRLRQFRTTPESQMMLEDLSLAADVRAALIDLKPDVEVTAQDGLVRVATRAHESQEAALVRDLEGIVAGVPGVREVHVNVTPITSFDL